MLSLFFPAQCTRKGAAGVTFQLPDGRHAEPHSVPVRFAVCCRVFQGLSIPHQILEWAPFLSGGPRGRLEPVRRPRHCQLSMRAWTRARLERFANWSPDKATAAPLIHATRAPSQGTALLQVTPQLLFHLNMHGEVPEGRGGTPRLAPTRWTRSVS